MRQESTDLTVIPAREDATTVVHELDSVALEAWHFDTEQLLAGGCVPDADVIDGACGEQIRVACRERNVIDALIVACVSELWSDCV